jgi:hypothetical protein
LPGSALGTRRGPAGLRPACPRKLRSYCVVVAGGVAGAAGSGVAGGVVAGGVVAGCSVVVGAGAVASVGACPPNHPAAQPIMATRMTTTITPMTMFLFSIIPSLAQIAGRRPFRRHEIWLQNDPAKRLAQGVPRTPNFRHPAGRRDPDLQPANMRKVWVPTFVGITEERGTCAAPRNLSQI